MECRPGGLRIDSHLVLDAEAGPSRRVIVHRTVLNLGIHERSARVVGWTLCANTIILRPPKMECGNPVLHITKPSGAVGVRPATRLGVTTRSADRMLSHA